MGFSAEDVDVIRSLVEHHLLLPETAMRRDLADPRTAANVADAVGDPLRLELLRALTEADSLATGPSAWSSWKAALLDQLVARGRRRCFAGEPPAPTRATDVDERFGDLLDAVRAGRPAAHRARAVGRLRPCCAVATPDQPGLFAKVAGTLADARHRRRRRRRVDEPRRRSRSTSSSVPRCERRDAELRKRSSTTCATCSAGTIDIGGRIEQRMRTYQRAHRRAVAASAAAPRGAGQQRRQRLDDDDRRPRPGCAGGALPAVVGAGRAGASTSARPRWPRSATRWSTCSTSQPGRDGAHGCASVPVGEHGDLRAAAEGVAADPVTAVAGSCCDGVGAT